MPDDDVTEEEVVTLKTPLHPATLPDGTPMWTPCSPQRTEPLTTGKGPISPADGATFFLAMEIARQRDEALQRTEEAVKLFDEQHKELTEMTGAWAEAREKNVELEKELKEERESAKKMKMELVEALQAKEVAWEKAGECRKQWVEEKKALKERADRAEREGLWLKNRARQLQAEAEVAKKTLTDANKKWSEENERIAALEKKAAELTEENEELKRKVPALKMANTKLKNTNDALRAGAGMLNQELEERRAAAKKDASAARLMMSFKRMGKDIAKITSTF